MSYSPFSVMSPKKVEILPTYRCNLTCIFCDNYQRVQLSSDNSIKQTMTLEEWLRIVKEWGEIGVQEIHITGGGEPLCVSDMLFPIMKLIKSYGVHSSLTTNGTLWKKKVYN